MKSRFVEREREVGEEISHRLWSCGVGICLEEDGKNKEFKAFKVLRVSVGWRWHYQDCVPGCWDVGEEGSKTLKTEGIGIKERE